MGFVWLRIRISESASSFLASFIPATLLAWGSEHGLLIMTSLAVARRFLDGIYVSDKTTVVKED